MTRHCTPLFLVAVLAALVASEALDSRISAETQTVRKLSSHSEAPGTFRELPQNLSPNAPEFWSFRDTPRVPDDIFSTFLVTFNARTCRLVFPAGTTQNPANLLGGSYLGAVSIALAGLNDPQTLDTLVVAPAGPSNRPMTLYSWPPPMTSLGEINVTGMATGGMFNAFGTLFGSSQQLVSSFGPGGPPAVTVTELARDGMFTFEPYGTSFTGGIFVATGDTNGDGHAEIFTSQVQNGGELKGFYTHGTDIVDFASGRPYGHAFSGGFFVTVFDFNNDGRGEIVTVPQTGPVNMRVWNVAGLFGPELVAEVQAFEQNTRYGASVAPGFVAGRPVIMVSTGRTFRRFDLGNDGRFTLNTTLQQNLYSATTDGPSSVYSHTPPISASSRNRR
jgi:hypothetical protein